MVGAGGAKVVGESVVGASELPFGVVLSGVVGSSVVTVKINLICKWFSFNIFDYLPDGKAKESILCVYWKC